MCYPLLESICRAPLAALGIVPCCFFTITIPALCPPPPGLAPYQKKIRIHSIQLAAHGSKTGGANRSGWALALFPAPPLRERCHPQVSRGEAESEPSPFSSRDFCSNGKLNFFAAYQGAAKYPIENMMENRFANLDDPKKAKPVFGNDETTNGDFLNSAAKAGAYIEANRSRYQTGNADKVPYHWGNLNDLMNTFIVITVDGTEIYRYPK